MSTTKEPTEQNSLSYLSVGFDVGADFAFMTIAAPGGVIVGKPQKVVYDNPKSRQRALDKIEEARKKFSLDCNCYLESTGIYHRPLARFLSDNGFEVFIINPIITKNSTNVDVRKVKNDAADSRRIAQLGLNQSLKTSLVPTNQAQALRDLGREYYRVIDKQSGVAQKFRAQLKVCWPDYGSVFSSIVGKGSFAVLEKRPGPAEFLEADEAAMIALIRKASRRGEAFAKAKYEALKAAAEDALAFGVQSAADAPRIQGFISLYNSYQETANGFLGAIKELLDRPDYAPIKAQVELLMTMRGVGFISAVVFLAELGSPEAFSSPRQVIAYFGLDPSVCQSGNFKASSGKISKRGSALARRVLHTAAMQNVQLNKATNEPVNPVLYDFYSRKTESKPKSVALCAVSRKICSVLFAMLRDNQPYVMRAAEEQEELWNNSRRNHA